MMTTQRMPGSVSLSRLKVYDSLAPDGQRGGTPHVHLLCSEMYVVIGGTGMVEMIDAGGWSRVPLQPNTSLLFSPGTIHRLINTGDLDIMVIMQNSGLPEQGDNVVCLPDAWLTTDEQFSAAMRVTTLDDAYRRRDLGVEGFLTLKAAFDTDMETGRAALERFYTLAEQRTARFRAGWTQIVEGGALADAHQSQDRLSDLQAADTAYLFSAQHQLIQTNDTPALGFCGRLHRYLDPARLQPEGLQQT